MEIYVDGASAGNPGPSGIGIVITADGIHEQISIPLGILSNHEAEFIAIKTALTKAIPYNPTFIRLYSDSKVAIEAIEKRYTKKSTISTAFRYDSSFDRIHRPLLYPMDS